MRTVLFLLLSLPAHADLQVGPSSIQFGRVAIGKTSGAGNIGIFNWSGTTSVVGLEIIRKSCDEKNFSFTTNCGLTMPVNTNCALKVYFHPIEVRAYRCQITIGAQGETGKALVQFFGRGQN